MGMNKNKSACHGNGQTPIVEKQKINQEEDGIGKCLLKSFGFVK
jgi:hypothetical protein